MDWMFIICMAIAGCKLLFDIQDVVRQTVREELDADKKRDQ